jgi:hypothetical protein
MDAPKVESGSDSSASHQGWAQRMVLEEGVEPTRPLPGTRF